MRQTPNTKIGFNDTWLMVIGILVLGFIIPIVFFGARFGIHPYFRGIFFFTCLVTTACIWIGNRYILIWARTRYPEFEQVRQRHRIQYRVMFLFTLIANNLLGFLFRDICRADLPGRSPMDILINCNFAALICSLTVVAIYESIYFMAELKKSVQEKELLKRESLVAQWNALKTQVNPHFLFNNLNTLSSIIPDNPGQAVDFVQELSKVYRHILEVRDEQSILLSEELDVLKAYAFLLKTRFGENLSISIRVPADRLQQKIVPLSLQILMENAIKHNIVSSAKPLQIDVFAENGRLVVRNTLQKRHQSNESTGIGLDNIRNRYKLLGGREVDVKEDASSFTVSIPLIDNQPLHRK
ncbi:MAG: histidine kinase [Bacteroidota bacterium]|nr:histidine kinase [Bacteroidota bacterium]MDP4216394.1 histidine kinase [Bacteroidota bacterium]MDP4245511.1 histidine kinase [Bacteroidota bacterium]MDP4258986.1 histidine kinase [Bacteroidota bacterium]